MNHGPDQMSTAELIAAILGNGTKGISIMEMAHELTYLYGNKLKDVTIEELCRVRGMGKVKAVQLKAALSLGMRAAVKPEGAQKKRVTHPKDAYAYIKDDIGDETRELLIAILLDVKGFAIGKKMISTGTLTRTLIHPREVFYFAIRHKAAGLILVHNHPSGDLTPSKADIQATENLISVGVMMGIPLYDHLIVGNGQFVSLREQGIKFTQTKSS